MSRNIIHDNEINVRSDSNKDLIIKNKSTGSLLKINDNSSDMHKSFVKELPAESLKKAVNDDMTSLLKNKKGSAKKKGIAGQEKPKLNKSHKKQKLSKSKRVEEQHRNISFRIVGNTKDNIIKSYKAAEGISFQDENMRTFVGAKSITKAVLKSPKKTYKVVNRSVKTSYKSVKTGYKVTKFAVKTAHMASKAIIKATVAVVSFLVANLPIILATMAVAVVVLSIISIFTSIFANITLKSDDVELTKAYSYMTQLDSELTAEIINIQLVENEQIQIYVNGTACKIKDFKIKTDVDMALAWFDAEYEDYAFDAIIYGILGGTNIKEEIDLIWQDLYSYKIDKIYDSDKGTFISRVDVHTEPFDDFAKRNIPENKDSYELMKKIGVYTSKSELIKPFDFDFVLNRYGFYFSLVDNGWLNSYTARLHMHSGIDLKAAEGTEVKAGISGTVTSVEYNEEYGYCVTIENSSGSTKKSIKYCKLKDEHVKYGKKIEQGDIIGYVGNTGTNCSEYGTCIHIEYFKDGESVVPSMYFK